MSTTLGLSSIDGVFLSVVELANAKVTNDRVLGLVTGERYRVQATDGGSGVLLASGNYANETNDHQYD